jgi:hypothetical protein
MTEILKPSELRRLLGAIVFNTDRYGVARVYRISSFGPTGVFLQEVKEALDHAVTHTEAEGTSTVWTLKDNIRAQLCGGDVDVLPLGKTTTARKYMPDESKPAEGRYAFGSKSNCFLTFDPAQFKSRKLSGAPNFKASQAAAQPRAAKEDKKPKKRAHSEKAAKQSKKKKAKKSTKAAAAAEEEEEDEAPPPQVDAEADVATTEVEEEEEERKPRKKGGKKQQGAAVATASGVNAADEADGAAQQ